MHSSLFVGFLAVSVNALSRRHEDGDCSPNPPGVAQYTVPGDYQAWEASSLFSQAANGAKTPAGYSLTFQNQQASVIDNAHYLSYDSLTSYDPAYCAQRCSQGLNQLAGCSSFNIYFERDATIDPGVNCTNPPSLTYIKCAYYSDCITQAEATNVGQLCQDFHHVIAGSNAYGVNNCGVKSSSTTTTTTTNSKSATTKITTVTTTTTSKIVTTTKAATTPAVTTTKAATTPQTQKTSTKTTTSAQASKTKSWGSVPSCSACSNGVTTDKNGKQYSIQCNTNFWGSDLGPVAATCYQDCFDICDKNPQCNAFSFDTTTSSPVSCWPKSISSNNWGSVYTQQGVTFGQLKPTCAACVPGTTTDGSGQQWSVSCDSNYWGSDFNQQSASCYDDCFDLCDNAKGCTAFTFDSSTGICWLKNPWGGNLTPYTSPGNTFAQMVSQQQSSNNGNGNGNGKGNSNGGSNGWQSWNSWSSWNNWSQNWNSWAPSSWFSWK